MEARNRQSQLGAALKEGAGGQDGSEGGTQSCRHNSPIIVACLDKSQVRCALPLSPSP